MGAKPSQRLRFLRDALPAERIEAFGFDESDGHVPIEQRVVRLEDALLSALA